MRQVFLLISLMFTWFMCCKNHTNPVKRSNPRLGITAPAHTPQSSPVAESLEVSRDRFKQLAAECRKITMERNGSPEVVQPLNPTHDVLSKTNHPPQ